MDHGLSSTVSSCGLRQWCGALADIFIIRKGGTQWKRPFLTKLVFSKLVDFFIVSVALYSEDKPALPGSMHSSGGVSRGISRSALAWRRDDALGDFVDMTVAALLGLGSCATSSLTKRSFTVTCVRLRATGCPAQRV